MDTHIEYGPGPKGPRALLAARGGGAPWYRYIGRTSNMAACPGPYSIWVSMKDYGPWTGHIGGHYLGSGQQESKVVFSHCKY